MFCKLSFLENGLYTYTSNLVKKIIYPIRDDSNILAKISNHVSKLDYNISDKNYFFRNRRGSEILESGFVTGCTDVALAFIVLSREAGIPTRYVETVSEDWLKNKNSDCVTGHVFVDIFKGGWKAYEPLNGFLKSDENYFFDNVKFVDVGKGLDFVELYIKDKNNFYDTSPINLNTLEKMVSVFKKY
jgi:Transglutaminase-like superfamily